MTATRWWTAVGSVLAVATLGWGSFQVVELIAREQRVVVTRIDEPVAAIEVSAGHGSVRVVAVPDGQVVLTERVSEGLRAAEVSHELIDGRLVARSSCPVVSGPWCSVNYVVEVPEGTEVTVSTEHGDIRVEGAAGAVDVETEHGDIEAVSTTGAVRAFSRHGDIDLAPGEPPESVRAVTRHGDIDLVLPDTPDAYRLELTTRDGDTVNAVRSDPAGDRTIELSTRHGDVTVRYGP